MHGQNHRDFNCTVTINGEFEVYSTLEDLDKLDKLEARKSKNCGIEQHTISIVTKNGLVSSLYGGSLLNPDSLKDLAQKSTNGIILIHRICGEDMSTGREVCYNDIIVRIVEGYESYKRPKNLFKKKLRDTENLLTTCMIDDTYELFEHLNFVPIGFKISVLESGVTKKVSYDEVHNFNIREWVKDNAQIGEHVILNRIKLEDFDKEYLHPPYVFEYIE